MTSTIQAAHSDCNIEVKSTGLTVVNVAYPSTMGAIGINAIQASVNWKEFNAPNNPADGLFHPFAPSLGDTWFFQVGAISINNLNVYLPRWSDNGESLTVAKRRTATSGE